MSAPTSPSSPRSGPSSADLFEFEGADELQRFWREGLTPDPPLTVSEWADRHRFLSPRASAEPGRYRTDRTPYMRAIMDALSPSHAARRVAFMKAAQVGATEAGNNWIGYVIHHAPGPMLSVQPTVELAKRFSRQRIEPLIAESPALRERVRPARSRDAGNTVLSKEFPAGLLVITGANSAVGLRSMPARYLFLDEVDAYPPSADEEGDPVALAEARTRTFSWRSKAFLASTPTIHGVSRIEREFEASDRRRFFVPCPHCGERQWLKFERLRWEQGAPDGARYLCESCEGAIGEHHKTAMLAAGEWRATAVAADPGTIGFHISGLYSPVGWLSWAEIARMWEAAQGSDEARRSFRNGVLGETWVETAEAPDWQRLYERREAWPMGTVPAGGLFLTAGADVQKDRIEVSVWAWGRGLESWLVEHLVIGGGPEQAETWAALTATLGRTWPHAHGARLGLARLAVDAGYESPAVYAWARAAGFAQVSPVKGVEGFNRAAPVLGPSYVDVTEGGKKLRRGARLWTVAVSTFKSETYRFLRLARPADEEMAQGARCPAGYIHLPHGLDAEHVKQLVAEQLVTVKSTAGFGGLGPVQLAGVPASPAGRLGFVVAVGNGNSCPYWIDDGAGAFEIGIGTVATGTPDTLSRDLVVRSSALNNAKVDFAAGVKDVVSGPFAAMFEQGPSELTLADGAVTLRGRNHTVDTEGDAAAGDLVSVGWGAVPDGHTVSLLAENEARVVTVKSRTFGGAGNVYLRGGDKRLSTLFPMVLQRRGDDAVEIASPRGDGWVTLQTQDPAGVSSCDFSQLLAEEFDAHRLIFVRLRPAVDGDSPQVQVSQNGAFVAGSGYAYHVGGGVGTGTGYAASFSPGGANFALSHAGVGFEPGQEPFNGTFEIYGCRLAAAHFAISRAVHGNTIGVAVSAVMGGLQNSAAVIDGLRFKFGGGNITSGRIILQGLRRQQ